MGANKVFLIKLLNNEYSLLSEVGGGAPPRFSATDIAVLNFPVIILLCCSGVCGV